MNDKVKLTQMDNQCLSIKSLNSNDKSYTMLLNLMKKKYYFFLTRNHIQWKVDDRNDVSHLLEIVTKEKFAFNQED